MNFVVDAVNDGLLKKGKSINMVNCLWCAVMSTEMKEQQPSVERSAIGTCLGVVDIIKTTKCNLVNMLAENNIYFTGGRKTKPQQST